MTTIEKRLVPRTLLGDVDPAAVTLLLRGQRIAIERLRDISSSGISFTVHQAIAVSEHIAIEYADPKVKLEVFGRVAWCSQTDKPPEHESGNSYLMGVELLSPMMLFAVLPRA